MLYSVFLSSRWDTGSVLFLSIPFLYRLWAKVSLFRDHPIIIHQDFEVNKRRINSCPSLHSYWPSPYYVFDHHGQLQTILQHCIRLFSSVLFSGVTYKRELLLLGDGGTIGLDWAITSRIKQVSDNAPIVMIMHGLCGSAYSVYIIHFVEKMVKEGYRVVIHVARGCGGLDLTSPEGFTGARTDDFHEAVGHVRNRYPDSKLFAVGYSLGAGLMLKYLGKHPESPLTAAVCVSPPWNFHASTGVFSSWSFIIVQSLKAYFMKHFHIFRNQRKISARSVLMSSSIRAFDSQIVGMYGYTDVEEYYTDASPCRLSRNIVTPTLAVSAIDDPVCCISGCPELDSCGEKDAYDVITGSSGIIGPGLIVVKTKLGGHLGFAEGLLPLRDSWADQLALEWFNAVIIEAS